MCREGTNVIKSLPYIVRRFVPYKFPTYHLRASFYNVHMCTLQVEASLARGRKGKSLPFPAPEALHGMVIAGQTTHVSSTCKFYNVHMCTLQVAN